MGGNHGDPTLRTQGASRMVQLAKLEDNMRHARAMFEPFLLFHTYI